MKNMAYKELPMAANFVEYPLEVADPHQFRLFAGATFDACGSKEAEKTCIR